MRDVPTTAALEKKIASLEGTEDAIVPASGMAAVSIAIMISARAGDHVVVSNDLFVISRQFFEQDCPALGIEVTFVDIRDLEQVAAAIRFDDPQRAIASIAAFPDGRAKSDLLAAAEYCVSRDR